MNDAGDDWAGWWQRHGPALLLLARQRLPDRADAEDALQEAFARFWATRHRAADPTAYLFACVRNASAMELRGTLRRRRREASVSRTEAEPLLESPTEQHERRRLIEAALGGLPDDQREVVVMKIWGELTFDQIGQALDVPMHTAASRYRYALAKLRELLAEATV